MPARAPYFVENPDFAQIRGLQRHPLRDAYHVFLRLPWPLAIAGLVGMFLVVNLLFALVYLATGGIEGARPGSLADAFFFSVETLATVGYGAMHPQSTAAHVTSVIQIFTGTLLLALTTGLVFSKFSLPSSRVLFTDKMTVGLMDGVPTLMFRLANERGGRVLHVEIRLQMGREEQTKEGMSLYRMIDLPLQAERVSTLSRTWIGMHKITPGSPLHGATAETLARWDAEFLITLYGTDMQTAQPLLAAHSWVFDQIAFDSRFADMLIDLPDGKQLVDFANFHKTRPSP